MIRQAVQASYVIDNSLNMDTGRDGHVSIRRIYGSGPFCSTLDVFGASLNSHVVHGWPLHAIHNSSPVSGTNTVELFISQCRREVSDCACWRWRGLCCRRKCTKLVLGDPAKPAAPKSSLPCIKQTLVKTRVSCSTTRTAPHLIDQSKPRRDLPTVVHHFQFAIIT
jgi:hypothetical protein